MTDQMILNIVRDSFYYVLLVSGPILLVSLVVGLMISMFQAATTISEQTLTFVPKIIAVFLTVVLLIPFIIQKLKYFTVQIINIISTLR
ncbi:MAG: Flagellar biosynthesis protein FliQ [Candidatus Kapaibacterium sp.]|jgi:flagellar biosynthetic protein FliQ|nr:MAG: Flagellar biosynthesis protein FliQ [Candidatus Kapabacteria bacterium]ROL56398.1 MAG: flagellar biosynthetic protein FliQ [Bacteroidetes/Chlorobi group bacterium Naka2016]